MKIGKKIPQDVIARAIADAETMSDNDAAIKNGIGVATLRRYRKGLNNSSALALAVETHISGPKAQDWLEAAPEALAAAMEFLKRAATDLDTSNYRDVQTVIAALEAINETKLSAEMISAQMKR